MDEKTYVFGQDANNAFPYWAMNNNGLFNGNGIGGGIVGFLFGLMCGNGGNGIFGGGNNNQNANTQREFLLTALTAQGEASRAATQNLANSIGQDFNIVNGGVMAIQGILSSIATQQAVSVPQIINAIQAGDSAITNQFAQCCCENKLLVTSQGYENQIATLNQTNQLGAQADRNANSIIGAINAQTVAMNEQFCAAKERDMQSKIDSLLADNSVLRSTISENRQTERFLGAFNALDQKITELAAKQPQTVPVQWPQLTAVSTTPYMGNYYGYGYQGNIWG